MTGKRPLRPADREFRIDAVHRPTPDLHKLAQVFLGMALARAEADKQRHEPATEGGQVAGGAAGGAVE